MSIKANQSLSNVWGDIANVANTVQLYGLLEHGWLQLINPNFYPFWVCLLLKSIDDLGYVPQACRIHDTYYAIFRHGCRIMDVCFKLCGYFPRFPTDIIYFNISSVSVLVDDA